MSKIGASYSLLRIGPLSVLAGILAVVLMSGGLRADQEKQSQPFDTEYSKRDPLREQLNGRAAIAIRRTGGGWGTGPRYSIRLFSDGELYISGIQYPGQQKPEGAAAPFRIDPSVFKIVEQELERLKEDHCDKYIITDQGTIYYRLLSDSKDIEFSVYTGCLSPIDKGQRLSKVIKDALDITIPDMW